MLRACAVNLHKARIKRASTYTALTITLFFWWLINTLIKNHAICGGEGLSSSLFEFSGITAQQRVSAILYLDHQRRSKPVQPKELLSNWSPPLQERVTKVTVGFTSPSCQSKFYMFGERNTTKRPVVRRGAPTDQSAVWIFFSTWRTEKF